MGRYCWTLILPLSHSDFVLSLSLYSTWIKGVRWHQRRWLWLCQLSSRECEQCGTHKTIAKKRTRLELWLILLFRGSLCLIVGPSNVRLSTEDGLRFQVTLLREPLFLECCFWISSIHCKGASVSPSVALGSHSLSMLRKKKRLPSPICPNVLSA